MFPWRVVRCTGSSLHMKNIHVDFIQLVYAVNYNKFNHKSLGYVLSFGGKNNY